MTQSDAADRGSAERVVVVYTTFPALVEAERVGRLIVQERLAACVNILPGMVSHYWWEGRLERGQETVMFIKTRASLADAVRQKVRAEHPYVTPAILILPVEGGDPAYLHWIVSEASAGARP